MHFVMSAFSHHVEVLHNVTPIDLPAQSAVLSDGVVFSYPTNLRKLVGADLYIRPQCIVLAYNIVCHLIHGNDHYVARGG